MHKAVRKSSQRLVRRARYLTINWLNLDTGEIPAEPITLWNTPNGLKP